MFMIDGVLVLMKYGKKIFKNWWLIGYGEWIINYIDINIYLVLIIMEIKRENVKNKIFWIVYFYM